MKKFTLMLFILVFSFLLNLAQPRLILAQWEPHCTGVNTGFPGTCTLGFCGGTDGQAECSFPRRCCVVDTNNPECTGDTTGFPGNCVPAITDCGSNADGGDSCPFAMKCCVVQIGASPTPTGAPTPTPGGPTPGGGPDVICNVEGIDTAIGCITVLVEGGSSDVAEFFIKWGIGVGGGIAFLLVIYAGFIIMTSAGNPQRLSAGKELLTAALSGLVLIVFFRLLIKNNRSRYFGAFLLEHTK